jgi:hypothetical protein
MEETMRKFQHAALLMLACLLALWSDAASAQVRCKEGRLTKDLCANASLATAMREVAIIFSQPKISQTAFPVLPSADRAYRYPNQLIPDPLKPSPVGTPIIPAP